MKAVSKEEYEYLSQFKEKLDLFKAHGIWTGVDTSHLKKMDSIYRRLNNLPDREPCSGCTQEIVTNSYNLVKNYEAKQAEDLGREAGANVDPPPSQDRGKHHGGKGNKNKRHRI